MYAMPREDIKEINISLQTRDLLNDVYFQADAIEDGWKIGAFKEREALLKRSFDKLACSSPDLALQYLTKKLRWLFCCQITYQDASDDLKLRTILQMQWAHLDMVLHPAVFHLAMKNLRTQRSCMITLICLAKEELKLSSQTRKEFINSYRSFTRILVGLQNVENRENAASLVKELITTSINHTLFLEMVLTAFFNNGAIIVYRQDIIDVEFYSLAKTLFPLWEHITAPYQHPAQNRYNGKNAKPRLSKAKLAKINAKMKELVLI